MWGETGLVSYYFSEAKRHAIVHAVGRGNRGHGTGRGGNGSVVVVWDVG